MCLNQSKIYENVSLIIPTFNEGNRLKETLDCIPFDKFKEVILVNDGSTDKTEKIAYSYPLYLLNFNQNRGKGFAVSRGIKVSTGKIILLADADLGKSIGEVKKLILPIKQGEVDVTIAQIPIVSGGLGLVRFLAYRGVLWLGNETMEAPLSGQRCLRREVLKSILPLEPRFGLEVGMNIDLLHHNYRIKELQVNFSHQRTGNKPEDILHRMRQFLDISYTLGKKFIQYYLIKKENINVTS